MLNLDQNATTPLHPEVAAAMQEALLRYPGNPSSLHRLGQQARTALEDARDGISELLGLRPRDRLVFTSGGTEANNLALRGIVPPDGRLVISSIEHPSCSRAAAELARIGARVDWVRVTPTGRVDVDHLQELLRRPADLVSIMWANNETGVLQPIDQVAAICSRAGVPWHTDAAQAVGKIRVGFGSSQASSMTVAAHKFHGPVGVGALCLRAEAALRPLQLGGPQEHDLRAGTEAVALAIGMWKALQLWDAEAGERERRLTGLRQRLEETLRQDLPDMHVHGSSVDRLPQTSCISFPGIPRQQMLLALDTAGVACSSGSACASGSSEPSPTLVAMGVAEDLVSTAVRFSFGALTEPWEIDTACRAISKTGRDLQHRIQQRKKGTSSRQQASKPL